MGPYTTDIVYRNSIDLARIMLAGVNGLVSIATEYVTKEHLAAAKASGGDAIDLDPERGTFMSRQTLPSSIVLLLPTDCPR